MSETAADIYTHYQYDCPYRRRCSDEGVRCDSCYHSSKKSYYIPEPVPYVPYPTSPWYPYNPWSQPWTIYTGDSA
jgi:hypothetical protein